MRLFGGVVSLRVSKQYTLAISATVVDFLALVKAT